MSYKDKPLDLVLRHPNPEDKTPRSVQNFGRNKPCPCGSGKKFKKCHGGRHVRYPEYPEGFKR